MSSLDSDQQRMLVRLAVTTRPIGSTKWDDQGTASYVRRLVDQGFSAQEVIDRTLKHAWDRSARTPAVLMHPTPSSPVPASNPAAYPVKRDAECPLHPGKPATSCSACAADAIASDPERRGKTPIYDEAGHKLRHRPLRELFEETRSELETPKENA